MPALASLLAAALAAAAAGGAPVAFLGSATAIPSPEQLQWMDFEVGAMITFNLQSLCVPCGGANATRQRCQASGCVPTLAAVREWELAGLSTDAWLDAAVSFGARYAVLVADHMTGFTLWPTRVHNVSIAATRYRGGAGDVVAEFRASAAARGIAPGFFYSTHYNWVLGVNDYAVGWPRVFGGAPLSAAAYQEAVLAQLAELAAYGAWAELWLDGGANVSATPLLPARIRAAFPDSMCHSCSPFTEAAPRAGGRGIRWMGNENGLMPLPSWAAADADGTTSPSGTPTGALFIPPSCDTVLEQHYWFYAPGDVAHLRPTCELVNVYLTSVGRASNLILNLAPGADGALQPAEVAAYGALGAAVDCLWRAPLGEWAAVAIDLASGASGALALPSPLPCAAGCSLTLVLQEELASAGQRVGAWAVDARVGGAWVPATPPAAPAAALTGVGHKRIVALRAAAGFDALRLRVATAYTAAGDAAAPISFIKAALFDSSESESSENCR
jgi:hypothetical protein